MEENWKPVIGFEGQYEVSDKGNVRSLRRLIEGKSGTKYYRDGCILKPQTSSSYAQVYLTVDGKQKWFKVHRLVAEAFIPNPDNLPCINHKDENKLNNSVDNLEWCDYEYNSNYGTAKERMSKTLHEIRQKQFQKKLDDLGMTREEYIINRRKEYYKNNREKIIKNSLERYYRNRLY